LESATSAVNKVLQAPEKMAQSTGSNFYYSFLLLPAAKRRAMNNVYGFCRIIDDIVDEDHEGRDPAQDLDRWREEIEACYQGIPTTDFGERLLETIEEFDLPKEPFLDLIDGMEMDLQWSSYETFADLREYCYRVASAVGLLCIEIFGYESLTAREYAVNLGLALQLTNILRDLREDVSRGRIYIPIEDLERFGYSRDDLSRGVYNTPFVDLMKFQCSRARSYFERAAAVLPEEDRSSLFAAEIMGAIYRELLELIVDAHYNVYRTRLSVPKKTRLKIAFKLWSSAKLKEWLPIGAKAREI